MIRKAREQWYAIIQEQNVGTERALDTARRYCGRWDYFNLSIICGFIDDHKIRFDSRYRNDLIAKGFFNGQYLKEYIEEMLNIIIGCVG